MNTSKVTQTGIKYLEMLLKKVNFQAQEISPRNYRKMN